MLNQVFYEPDNKMFNTNGQLDFGQMIADSQFWQSLYAGQNPSRPSSGGGGSAAGSGSGGGNAPNPVGSAGGSAGGAAGGTASGSGSGSGSNFDWAKLISGLFGVAGAAGVGSGSSRSGPVTVPGGVTDPRLYKSAYGNLYNILMGQGRTDPLALNRQTTAIGRGGVATSDAVRGDAARAGYGTGLSAALQAAIGQGTASQQQGAIARENQLAEERKRRDLGLFLQMVLQPNIEYQALATGQYNANREHDTQQNAAMMSALAALIGSFAKSNTSN